MTRVTTHVLDTGTGRPAVGIGVRLERLQGARAELVSGAMTDADGRVRDWPNTADVPAGRYRLVFDAGAWFRAAARESIYSEIAIQFEVGEGVAHTHLPLLLSPFGYTTYRGS